MKPDPSAYRAAQLRARDLVGNMDPELARQIVEALERFADGLGARLSQDLGGLGARSLSSTRAIERAKAIVEATGNEMLAELTRAVQENRQVTYEQIEAIWKEQGRAVARSVGIDGALLGEIQRPPIRMLGAFDALGAAESWRTLLSGHARGAAGEANQIVRLGLVEGVEPDELARRLRRYVVGSEPFDKVFEEVPTLTGDVAKIDIGKIPKSQRARAAQMEWNARRIGWSEIHNARHEAEVQSMIRDPIIESVRWQLSPDRGSLVGSDECDVLADADMYGLGPGIYPVNKVPGPPHPMDLCENIPVTRDSARMRDPKPNPSLRMNPRRVSIPGGGDLSRSARRRIRDQVERAVSFGEQAVRSAA